MPVEATLNDVIDAIIEGNIRNDDKLHSMEGHERNSRRHLLEMKKMMILDTTIKPKIHDAVGDIRDSMSKTKEERMEAAMAAGHQRQLVEDQLEAQEETNDLLRDLKKDSSEGGGLGGIGIALAASIAALTGSIVGYSTVLKQATSGLNKLVPGFLKTGLGNISESIKKANQKLLKLPGRIARALRSMVLATTLNIGAATKSLRDSKVFKALASVTGRIARVINPIVSSFQVAGAWLRSVSKSATKGTSLIANIGKKFKGVTGVLKTVLGGAKILSKAVARIFPPIMWIIGIFTSIKEFIKGYQEDGIIEGFEKAIVGLFDFLIGTPLKLIADMTAWVLKKLGFDDAAKELTEFDPTKLFADLMNSISDLLKGGVKWVIDLFTGKKDFATALADIGGLIEKVLKLPLTLLQDAGVWLLGKFGFDDGAKVLKNFSIDNFFADLGKSIMASIDSAVTWVTDLFAGKKDFATVMTDILTFATKVITLPHTLIKDAVAWLLGKFGFDDGAKALKDFSITDFLADIGKGILGVIDSAVTWITDLFGGKRDLATVFTDISKFVNDMIWAPFNVVKDAVAWVLKKFGFDDAADKVSGFSPAQLIKDLADSVINKVTGIFTKLADLFEDFSMTNILNELIAMWNDIAKFDWMKIDPVVETGARTPKLGEIVDAGEKQLELTTAQRKAFQSGGSNVVGSGNTHVETHNNTYQHDVTPTPFRTEEDQKNTILYYSTYRAG